MQNLNLARAGYTTNKVELGHFQPLKAHLELGRVDLNLQEVLPCMPQVIFCSLCTRKRRYTGKGRGQTVEWGYGRKREREKSDGWTDGGRDGGRDRDVATFQRVCKARRVSSGDSRKKKYRAR